MVPRLSSVEGLCSSLLWTACLSLLVFLFYWRGVASFTLLKAVPIPGPRQWPYFGNLPDVIKYGGMHSMLWEYFQRYGRVYKMGFGRRPTIVITDPEMIKQITIKEFPKFQNRWFPEVNPPIISFLFIAKDDQWKRIRTTLSPTFSATKLKEVIPLMEEASDVLTGKLTEAAKTGEDGKFDYFPEYCFFLAASFANFSQSRLAVVKSFLWGVNETKLIVERKYPTQPPAKSWFATGGSERGGRAPPLFLDQTEGRRAEKKFFGDRPPPLSKGPTIRKVMEGVGNFQLPRIFFSLTACAGIFLVKPSTRIFFSDKYCFFLNTEILIHYLCFCAL